MRRDTLAHLGNSAAVTPFLDTFARTEGVSFRNAFCQNTVCVPSRCSFFTGLYPHVNGHRTMAHMLHRHETSLLKELKDSGYYVWMNSRNDFLAAQAEDIFAEHATETFYGGDIPPAPGARRNERGGSDSPMFYSFYHGELEVDTDGQNRTSDDEAISRAVEFIHDYDNGEPFCLFAGLQYPHPPYQIEEPYFSAVNRNKLSPRVIMNEDEREKKPKIINDLLDTQRLGGLEEADWDNIRSCYLGMCMKVDDYFRQICEALKAKGMYDQTAIFFFSDHGDYTGDYGVVEKTQNTFEDCLVNVPLLVKLPAGWDMETGINDNLVELIDVYATVMELCQVRPVHSHFGRSLLPVLANRRKNHREYVCSEGGRLAGELHCDETNGTSVNRFNPYYPRLTVQKDDIAHTKATMIRSDSYKYIRRLYEQDEFYDLRTDPREKDNQINNPAYAGQIARMRMELLEWYQATCDIVPYEQDQRFSYEMIWSRVKNICLPDMVTEIQQQIRSGAEMFQLIETLKRTVKERTDK